MGYFECNPHHFRTGFPQAEALLVYVLLAPMAGIIFADHSVVLIAMKLITSICPNLVQYSEGKIAGLSFLD